MIAQFKVQERKVVIRVSANSMTKHRALSRVGHPTHKIASTPHGYANPHYRKIWMCLDFLRSHLS